MLENKSNFTLTDRAKCPDSFYGNHLQYLVREMEAKLKKEKMTNSAFKNNRKLQILSAFSLLIRGHEWHKSSNPKDDKIILLAMENYAKEQAYNIYITRAYNSEEVMKADFEKAWRTENTEV